MESEVELAVYKPVEKAESFDMLETSVDPVAFLEGTPVDG